MPIKYAEFVYNRQEPSPYTTTGHILRSVYARYVLDFGNPFESDALWGDDTDSTSAAICVLWYCYKCPITTGDISFFVPHGGGCGGVESGIDDGRYHRTLSTKNVGTERVPPPSSWPQSSSPNSTRPRRTRRPHAESRETSDTRLSVGRPSAKCPPPAAVTRARWDLVRCASTRDFHLTVLDTRDEDDGNVRYEESACTTWQVNISHYRY